MRNPGKLHILAPQGMPISAYWHPHLKVLSTDQQTDRGRFLENTQSRKIPNSRSPLQLLHSAMKVHLTQKAITMAKL